jgi:hypothetical protein
MGNDDNNDYEGISTYNSSVVDDDFHSLRETNDYTWPSYTDDTYYSTKKTFGWFDNLLSNTTANPSGENQLTPAQDVNPDNVLATLVFNAVVCVILLGLYEILRRLIPSVYSQRLVYGGRSSSHSLIGGSENGNGGEGGGGMSPRSAHMASLSHLKASGSVCVRVGEEMKGNGTHGLAATREQQGQHNNSTASNDDSNTYCANFTPKTLSVLEWCAPIYNTPWSTFRQLAGLDAYFFLRYIRMCLKITAVSSFWACAILWPVYATGGGGQNGFYHFSMANVLQDEKGRVWVPTFFCWAFTMYCWFCVRREMIHYVELRMVFLGGGLEVEEAEAETNVSYDAPVRNELQGRDIQTQTSGTNLDEIIEEKAEESALFNKDESQAEGEEEMSPRSLSPFFPDTGSSEDEAELPVSLASLSFGENNETYEESVQLVKQHRYSLQVEKVPVALRSNTALFNYFNEMFPNQVHSVCLAMNVPDLEALSNRRLRVARRLEKSLAYYHATGSRPTHITGRPRFQCCGIESTPIDGMCLICCCCYDSCRMGSHFDDTSEDYPEHITDHLPDKGEIVDSISYYTLDLALCNIRMQKLQYAKFQIAITGRNQDGDHGGSVHGDDDHFQWYEKPLVWAKTEATRAAEGIREEFEVLGEEDALFQGKRASLYGSTSTVTKRRSLSSQQAEKRAPLVEEDHLTTDGASTSSVGDETTGVFRDGEKVKSSSCSRRHLSRSYTWLRSLLWSMGFDFLAAGLDEVRDRTGEFVP